MKRFKGIFLFLVIMLSFGITSNLYAGRHGEGRGGEWDEYHSSRREREDRNHGPRLDYDGRTSGIGSDIGAAAGAKVGSSIGKKYGGNQGKAIGGYVGGKAGSRIGDSWERKANQYAHDRWNSRGRKGHSGWRFSLEEDEDNYDE